MSDAKKKVAGAVSVVAALIPAVTVAASGPGDSIDGGRAGAAIGAFLGAIAGGAWFIYCFTGKAYDRRTHAIVFSYTFTFLALATALLSGPLSAMTDLRAKMATSPIGVVLGCVADRKAGPESGGDLGAIRCRGIGDQWLLNIGGRTWEKSVAAPEGGADAPPRRYVVSGGLVVPLYFVILAMMGGAVSLARRVPEIQKRSEDDYAGTEKAPKMLPGEVRECLAFQIMQFLSAPLIAVTAYYLVAPNSRASTAALAFSAGFASEPILLLIRSAVEKLSPAATTANTAPETGTAKGSVRKQGAPLAHASVSVVGHPSLRTQADSAGAFTIGAPVGERVLEASDGNGTTKLAKVTIEAGKTAACQLDL